MCLQAKDRKFAREFVFPGEVYGVLQLGFQILLHSGTSGLLLPSRQWQKELKISRKLTIFHLDVRMMIT